MTSNLFDRFKELIQPKEIQAGDQENQRFMIVGLGNPGKEYLKNRHNVGFMAINALAKEFGLENPRAKFKSIYLEGKVGKFKLFLVKPQSYMNLSGEPVSQLIRYFKLNTSQLIVIHDDLDLPSLTIRIRPGGGAGGQKGILSIIEKLGTQDFNRLRIGIGRPPGRMDPADYVLQNFSKTEEKELPLLFRRINDAVRCLLEEGITAAMNRFNSDQSNNR